MSYNWMSFIIDGNGNTQVKNKHLQKSKKEREQTLCKKSGMPIVSLFGMLAMQWNKNPNREASCWLDFDSQFWGHLLFWFGWVYHWSQCSWKCGNGRGCHSWRNHWSVCLCLSWYHLVVEGRLRCQHNWIGLKQGIQSLCSCSRSCWHSHPDPLTMGLNQNPR